MYNESPEEIVRRNSTKISAIQILSVVITVMVSLVLPIQLIELSKAGETNISPYFINSNTQQAGRVAGASTIVEDSASEVGQVLHLVGVDSETKSLIIIAGFLLFLGVGIMFYLLTSRKKPNMRPHSPDFILE